MTGWRTSKDVVDLRDEILEKLDAANPNVRRHAWYWNEIHMNIYHQLEETSCESRLDDELILWLRENPERFESMKLSKQQLVESLAKRLARAQDELRRLDTDQPNS